VESFEQRPVYMPLFVHNRWITQVSAHRIESESTVFYQKPWRLLFEMMS
jgi:hypothetical protein